MKNLKKVLALVLAFACAFTMFAGAAFTDQADINDVNADAVDLLTTLNIIKGYEDGSFQPDGTVTRAEMAKMIYTIRNDGNDDASPYETVTTSFTDISGHWAEGYIKYLQNTGIVAGKSDYIFDPDSTVTTGEAMKMALVLAGYRADKAELTGTKWLNNTVSLATTVGMTKNVQSTIAGGCTRQDAAQILSNTLTEVWAVQWSEVTNSFLNDSKEGLAFAGQRITVGDKWMDLTVYVGKMTSSGDLQVAGIDNDFDGDAGKDRFKVDVETVNNQMFTPDNGNTFMTFKDGKDHTDLVGQEVKVLCGEKIDEVYGVYATGTSNVVETTMDQVSVQSDNKVKVDGTTYDTKATTVYVDLEGTQAFAAVFSANGRVAADGVKLIDWDNDGKYETTLVNTVTAAKVNSVTDSSVTVGFTGSREPAVFGNTRTIDFDGNNIADGIVKGDYIAITQNLYDDTWNVAKIDKVEGTVNGLVKNEYKVRVEGEWYTLANDKATNATLYVVPGGRDTFTNGDKIVMYTIGNTVYFADSATGNDANRSVLMAYDSKMTGGAWNDTPQAKVILADGTKKTVNVVKIDDTASSAFTNNEGKIGELVVGQMYSYSINNDGDYTLTTIGAANLAGYDSYVDNAAGVHGSKVQTRMIADDAVVFALINGNDAAVYTGKTVKNTGYADGWGATANGGVLIEETNGINYARMFNIAITSKLDESSNYAVLLSDAVRSKSDSQYIEYHMWTGSEVVDVKEKTDAKNELTMLDGDVISYENDGEGMIKSVSKVNDDVKGLQAAILGYANGDINLLSANGADTFEINSDTTVIYFNTNNSDDARGVTGDGYDYPATLDDTGDHFVNAVYVLDNNDDAIKFILIDINGKLTGKTVESLHGNRFTADEVKNYGGLEALLADYDNIVVTDTYQLSELDDADDNGAVRIGATKTVQFLGNLDMNHQNLSVVPGADVSVDGLFWIHSTFAGTITVGSLKIGDPDGNVGTVAAGSKITVTTAQAVDTVVVEDNAVIDDTVVVTIDGTEYVANDANNNLEEDTDDPETPPVTPPVTDAKLPAPSVDGGNLKIPYTGNLNLDTLESYLDGTDYEGWKIQPKSGSGYEAVNPEDATEIITVNPVQMFHVTVEGWDGTTVPAYVESNGTMSNVPVGSYLATATGTAKTVTAKYPSTTAGDLSVGALKADTTFKPAVKVTATGLTITVDGKDVSSDAAAAQVGTKLTVSKAAETDLFGRITATVDGAVKTYGTVSAAGKDDDSVKATLDYTVAKEDKTGVTFEAQKLVKLTVDGTAMTNVETNDAYFAVGKDAYVDAAAVSDKKYMVIKSAVAPVDGTTDDNVAAITSDKVMVGREEKSAGKIDKGMIASTNAVNGTIELVEAVKLAAESHYSDTAGTAGKFTGTVTYNGKKLTMTDWTSKALYVPVGTIVQLTGEKGGTTKATFAIAITPDEEAIETAANIVHTEATDAVEAALNFTVVSGMTTVAVTYTPATT